MKKTIAILMLAVCIITSCGCKKKQDTVKQSGEDDSAVIRFENMIELQRTFFVGEVVGVSTVDALIPKYNIDVTEYTMYTVKVTESIDGIMPTGNVKVYCLGTTEQFPSRISLKRGETYILDAQPWVYGDEIVYLLSIYQVSYPRIDTSGYVTLESEDMIADCGSKEEYLQKYADTKTAYEAEHPGFFLPANILSRFKEQIDELYEVNNKDWLRADTAYNWTPSDDFIEKTRDRTQKLYDAVNALDADTVTLDDIAALFINEE